MLITHDVPGTKHGVETRIITGRQVRFMHFNSTTFGGDEMQLNHCSESRHGAGAIMALAELCG